MKTNKLFDQKLATEITKPIYENATIIPEELDYSIQEIQRMSDREFTSFAEKLRIHLLSLWESGHAIFYSNKDYDQIADDCRSLISEKIDSSLIYYKGKKIIKHKNFNVANQWFPEMSDVKVNSKSLIDQLHDPKIFRQNMLDITVRDRQKHGKNSNNMKRLSQFLIDGLRIVNRYQPVFNFPPTIAKLIYLLLINKNMEKDEWFILDPCMGWAGREVGLLAALCTPIANDKRVHYYGTDVNTATEGRFESILDFWNEHIKTDLKEQCDLYRSFEPAESLLNDSKFSQMRGQFDFAFTSPPYFGKEKYSEDETQSFIRYKTYENWRNGFLTGLIKSTYELLKTGAEFWLNIADVNKNSGDDIYYPLEQDSLDIAQSIGFEHVDTYYMVQHSFPGYKGKSHLLELDGKYKKYEPILCFSKV